MPMLNPAAVDGQNWTLKAIADHGGDDFAYCDTSAEVFSGLCEAALADDDPGGGSNTMTRPLPIVRYAP